MTIDEYMDYISEDIATEGLKDILASPDFANKLVRGAGDVLLGILDTLAANIIVLTNNLKGYVVYKESAKVMDLVIDKFDKMIDDCTFNFDRLIQGFSRGDIEKGIQIFEAKTLTQKTAARVAINEAIKAIDNFDKIFEVQCNDIELEFAVDVYTDPKALNKFVDSARLQQKMLRLQRKITNLTKKIRLSLNNRAILQKYGISREYAEELLSVNKAELARMGSVLISAFNIVYVRPHKGVKTDKQIEKIKERAIAKGEDPWYVEMYQSMIPHDENGQNGLCVGNWYQEAVDRVDRTAPSLKVATQMLNATD